jgi:hypothetical protein
VIDWAAATACADELLSRRDETARVVADAEAAAPRFRNRDFPLSPLPLFVSEPQARLVTSRLEAYVGVLGKASRLYREHAEVRRWYGLGPAAEALIDADTKLGDRVWVCRLDGYLEQGTERLVLLENNADAPAGTLFTARVNNLVAGILDRLGIRGVDPSPLTYRDEAALLDVLRSAASSVGADRIESVAVLQPAGRSNVESVEKVAVLQAHGVDAFVADPRGLRVEKGRAVFDGRPADACWNKVNTVAWEKLVADDPELVTRWVEALRDSSLVHVNPFGVRYVAESKMTLGFVQEPRFADLFDDEERALVAELLPWSRRFTAEVLAPDGGRSLYEELLDCPGDYVLKEPYDIRGDGVTIGRAVAYGVWRGAVDTALADGRLVQRYAAPTFYPTVRPSAPPVVPMAVSFDTYVLAGKACGFGSKASLAARVNVFQGGQKLACLVTPASDRGVEDGQ